MNMIADVTELAAATRVALLDLDAMPHDRASEHTARRMLSTRDYGVWTILREHLWEYGSLPVGLKALAKIAGIGVTSFARAAPKLARHFDPTAEGAWTDHVLMRARGSAVVVPAVEARPVDPALSAMRAAIGARGGRSSAERRREAAPETDGVLLQPEAKFQANGEANGEASEPSKSDVGGAANGSPAPGWLVGSNETISSKTNQPTVRADAAKSGQPGEAKPEQAKPAQASPDRAPPSPPEPGNDLVKAIREACPGKIEASTAGWGLKTVKTWIAKGCSFEADYLPVLKNFGETNKRVKNVANELIKAEVFRARDARLAAAGGRAERPDLSQASAATQAFHRALETALGADVYLSWGTRVAVIEVAGDSARLGVPTRFVKNWLEGKFSREVLAAMQAVQAGVARVTLEVLAGP